MMLFVFFLIIVAFTISNFRTSGTKVFLPYGLVIFTVLALLTTCLVMFVNYNFLIFIIPLMIYLFILLYKNFMTAFTFIACMLVSIGFILINNETYLENVATKHTVTYTYNATIYNDEIVINIPEGELKYSALYGLEKQIREENDKTGKIIFYGTVDVENICDFRNHDKVCTCTEKSICDKCREYIIDMKLNKNEFR